MRILWAIFLIVAGCGAIIYSFIGSVIEFAGDVDKTAQTGDGLSAFFMILDFILAGEVSRLTNFLYIGALMIAVAVVTLIVRRKPDDQ